MLTAGTVVERYRVVQRLGGGATAEVYLVEHTQLGTRYALKVLSYRGTAAHERTMREGRVQASLQHDNILAVRDVLSIQGMPALLMDFVDGPAMDTLLQNYRPNLVQLDDLARGILRGMAHAHSHGLVHRDLKPANILVAVDGERVVPRVADFGLVKLMQPDDASHHGTRTGAVLGTPMYMAPEQIRSAKDVDARADVFALGCVLYELVAGAPPYYGADLIELHAAMVARSCRPVSDWMPSAPRRMIQAIERALEPNGTLRPQDAGELLALWEASSPDPPGDIWEEEHRTLVRNLGPRTTGHAPRVGTAPAPVSSDPTDSVTLAGMMRSQAPGDRTVEAQGDDAVGALARGKGPTLIAPVGSTTAPDEHDEPAPPPPRRPIGLIIGVAAGVAVIGLLGVGGAGIALLASGALSPSDVELPAPILAGGAAQDTDAAATPDGSTEPVEDPVEEPVERPIGEPDGGSAGQASGASRPDSSAGRTTTTGAGSGMVGTDTGVQAADPSGSPEDPVAEPVVDPVVTPPPAITSWEVTGAHQAWLISASGDRHPPGPTPPGRYRLEVRYTADAPAVPAMTLDLAAGATRRISCQPLLKSCR